MAEGDIEDPVDYGSVVRNNLMNRPGYAPYCMGVRPGMPDSSCATALVRMRWDGQQFACACGSLTDFPEEFITLYRERWHG